MLIFAGNGVLLKFFTFLCVLFASNGFGAGGYDILGIFPMRAKSHWVIYSSLTNELARRGHNVEVYTVFPGTKKTPNYREIDLSSCFRNSKHFHNINFKDILGKNFIEELVMLYGIIPRPDELRNCSPIVNLAKSAKKFDALIVDPFDTDIFSIFATKFNASLINIFPNMLFGFLSDRMGSTSNPSYVNDLVVERPTSFSKKLYNVLLWVSRMIFYHFYSLPLTYEGSDEIFGSLVPPVEEVLRNTSLVLTNSHFSVSSSIPLVPGIVQVGGIHIQNATRLPHVSILYYFFEVLCDNKMKEDFGGINVHVHVMKYLLLANEYATVSGSVVIWLRPRKNLCEEFL